MNEAERLKKRLSKDRPSVMISMRMPEDVVEDLKALAPQLGFSGYQALIKFYVGQGLRNQARTDESASSKKKPARAVTPAAVSKRARKAG